ncbi:MAG: trehalose-phosphatase [Alphaproteobacteria bacterium]
MPAKPTNLAELVLDATPLALFVDVDGTLIEIASRPQDVEVATELPSLLTRLHDALDGALVLVSGRSLADLDRLFAPLTLPAGGQHGLEVRDAVGTVSRHAEEVTELAAMEDALARFLERTPGTLLEHKGMTLALHYRNAPDCESEARRVMAGLMADHGDHFHVQEGKMVMEIKPRGAHKGTVVDTFMDMPAFADRRPAFIGDDVTDEDGFAAVNRRRGISIQVGVRSPTVARWRARSVADLRVWLADLPARLGKPAVGRRPAS